MRGNKENHHSFPNSQQSDSEQLESQPSSLRQKITAECSIQVNMDADSENPLDSSAKKKNKRKEYRKRKREKGFEMEKQAKIELEDVIVEIFHHQTLFQKEKIRIQNSVFHLKGGDKFHEFLNQVIRRHVTNVQKQIWEYTQQILHENIFESDGSQDFYLQMVRKIYEEYLSIRLSSAQIEKIINYYMQLTSSNFSQDKQTYRYLDRSIFNYLIESDETLKNLIKICDKKVDHRHHEERFNLDKILDIVNYFEPSDYTDYDGDDEYDQEDDGEHSTTVSQSEISDKWQNNSAKKKNKRKKKIRDEEMKSEYDDVLARIEGLVIDEYQRASCNVTNDWLEGISKSVSETTLIKKLK